MIEDDGGRDFRYKSVWKQLVPLHRDECRNCTRPAVPNGRLCEDCLSVFRSDRSFGQYPLGLAVWVFGIAAVAVIAATVTAVNVGRNDAPAQASPTSTYRPAPTYAALQPTVRSNSQPSATSRPEVAFITALDEYEVPYAKSTAVSAGRKVCDIVDVGIAAGFTIMDSMDTAEAILADDGHTAAQAYAIVGAAVRALC